VEVHRAVLGVLLAGGRRRRLQPLRHGWRWPGARGARGIYGYDRHYGSSSAAGRYTGVCVREHCPAAAHPFIGKVLQRSNKWRGLSGLDLLRLDPGFFGRHTEPDAKKVWKPANTSLG
jgi:hypothetical protein